MDYLGTTDYLTSTVSQKVTSWTHYNEWEDVSALTTMVEGEIVVDNQTGTKDKKGKLDPETVAASPTLNKTSTVVKQFVVDYTTETFEPLMEYEVNGLDYRYVYGNDRLSVDVKGIENGAGSIIENGDHIRLYYHMDYLGTTDYLTSPVSKKVTSWTHYNEWGEITHNAVLKCGQRELDMVKRYATHDYDSVLNMYYAKARFYDAADRRFTAIDPILDGSKYDIKDYVKNPVQLVQYLYVESNPVNYIDLLGLQKLLPLSLLEEYGAEVTYRVVERRIGNYVGYYNQAVVTMNGNTRTFNAYPKTREFMRMGLCNNNKMVGNTMKVPSNYVLGFMKEYYFDSELYRGTVSAMLGFVPGVGDLKDIQEAITGYDIVEGRELTGFEKGVVRVAAVLPIMNRETVKFAVNTGEVTVNLVIDFAKVAKNSVLESDLLRALKKADSTAYEQFVKKTGREIASDAVKVIGKSTEQLTSLYRAMGPDEFYDLMNTGTFNIIPNGLQAKQFGLNFEQTLKYADSFSDYSAIIEVKVPTHLLDDLADYTPVDSFIFKDGTVTITADKLGEFNKIIRGLTHKY